VIRLLRGITQLLRGENGVLQVASDDARLSSRSISSLAGRPYPASASAETGMSTALAIRRIAANISSTGVSSPSP
jgi:hypothetical protein